MKNNVKKLLYGLGFDNKDGHTRITKGDNFRLYGGSEETHELMQEKSIKINEELRKKGKNLDNVSDKEFLDIADKVGIKPIEPPNAKN
ncbi:MAG: hypothetical protein P9M13_09605 [Candidatus Ancaeobacter aquaticus]|nr:hypothetical protein [Candidatus Ancaeobacter aquaticus]